MFGGNKRLKLPVSCFSLGWCYLDGSRGVEGGEKRRSEGLLQGSGVAGNPVTLRVVLPRETQQGVCPKQKETDPFVSPCGGRFRQLDSSYLGQFLLLQTSCNITSCCFLFSDLVLPSFPLRRAGLDDAMVFTGLSNTVGIISRATWQEKQC